MLHSPAFTAHSPVFEPRSVQGMAREEEIAGLEAEGMPLDGELAALALPFGGLEGWGMRRGARGRGREEQGTRLEEIFERCEALSGWERAGGMRLAGLVAWRLAPALFDN